MEEAETSHPSLALSFLVGQEMRGSRCYSTPGLFNVRHNNEVWQEAKIRGVTFLIYGAYLDQREEKSK